MFFFEKKTQFHPTLSSSVLQVLYQGDPNHRVLADPTLLQISDVAVHSRCIQRVSGLH